MDKENILKTGTTTIGLVCSDGVVLAADRRASAGTLIASKKTQKIYQVADNIAVTIAGTASDAQLLVKMLKSELRLNKIRLDRDWTVSEAANLLSTMVYHNIRKMSMIPGISHFIMGGKDKGVYSVYDIFADGSVQKIDDFIASGSGSVMAFGVLETLYKPGLSVEDGVKLAIQSINAAIQRDMASGDGLDVIVIGKTGFSKVVDEELKMKAVQKS